MSNLCTEDFLKYGRTIDLEKVKYWNKKEWKENDPVRQVASPNYHWGQLKLFYTELEFINLANEKYNLSESVVIYVGAGPGTHTQFLNKMFPEIHWILIDPVKFDIKENEKISIWTGDKGFFKDSTIPELLSHPFVKQSKYKLFISDIRTETKEDTVFSEMLDQQRWLLKIGADLSMLKFRLPYTLPGERNVWTYDITEIKKYIIQIAGKKDTPNRLYYLDGLLYIQLFPPQFSTETRLIVEKGSASKYKMKNYDTTLYEQKCLYYNINIRQKHISYKDSDLLEQHILGCRKTYEIASEYYIVESYLQNRKKSIDFESVCKTVYEIRNFHLDKMQINIGSLRFNKTLAIMQMFTIYKSKFPDIDKLKYFITRKGLDQDGIKKLSESINNLCQEANSFNKLQIQYFTDNKENPILSLEEYDKQIGLLKSGITVNDYLLTLINNMFTLYFKLHGK